MPHYVHVKLLFLLSSSSMTHWWLSSILSIIEEVCRFKSMVCIDNWSWDNKLAFTCKNHHIIEFMWHLSFVKSFAQLSRQIVHIISRWILFDENQQDRKKICVSRCPWKWNRWKSIDRCPLYRRDSLKSWVV